MTIILALCIPLTAFVVGFLVLKSVQLGLKWQIQTSKEEQPSLEVNPIKPIVEAKQAGKQEQQNTEQVSILSEWLYGEQESR